MRLILRPLFTILLFSFATITYSQTNFFKDVSESVIKTTIKDRKIIPKAFRTVQLDTTSLKTFLSKLPKEFSEGSRQNAAIINVPMPDGKLQRFSLVETEMMEPALAAKFPGIKTYGGQGIDDPYATIKLDWTPLGLHAMILSPVTGSVFIDPYAFNNNSFYISYFKKDVIPKNPLVEIGEITGMKGFNPALSRTAGLCIGGTLRTYRLAIACTGEYAQAVGGPSVTRAQALAAIVVSANRVNGVYEKELSIRMILVGNNEQIVYTNPVTDPFTGNDNATVLIVESQNVITLNIQPANYDIGHTFSTGGGGLAGLGVVCNDASKARGITGSPQPLGDPYDIDYVAHEIGHQFAGQHTFNAETNSCSGNRSASAAAEPGSGSTIQAYAGICGVNNLQRNSDAMFHAISFNEMTAFSMNGTGNSCAVQTSTGNTPPTASAGADYVIPKSTPFALTGTGSDPDNDAITYCWEQIDVNGPAGDWDKPTGNAPIFRSFLPVTTPSRTFPKMSDLLNNSTTIGEILPTYGRTINFRMTVRDNRSGGGGVCSDESMVTVDGNAGPFVVTSPNTAVSIPGGSFYKVKWDVAGTNAAPINTANVSIELSTDGGANFNTVLAASTPNDGTHEVAMPNIATTTARIRIRALGNVYFDISNANFTIGINNNSEFSFSEPDPVSACILPASTTLLTNSIKGFSTPIALSATGIPAGATITFSQNPVTPGNPVTISLNGTPAQGNHSVTITGTAGSVIKTRTIVFVVGTPANPPTIISPTADTSGVATTPTFRWSSVPGSQTYKLQVATNANFTSILHDVDNINATSYKLTTPLAQNTIYYWRIAAKNSCASGAFSPAALFKTGVASCPADSIFSNNVPVIITPLPATYTSTLTIPGEGVIISDLDVVGVRGTHTYVSDLSFSITSPSGTTVSLLSSVCDADDNFDLHFNDQAPAGPYSCPPINGQVRRPIEALAAFNNEKSGGTWTLTITDAFAQDGGSLDRWGLRICSLIATSLNTDHFRSRATGNWNSLNTWESSADNINWHVATLIPDLNAKSITIQSPHTVTVTANASGSKTTVNTGGALVVNSGVTLTTK